MHSTCRRALHRSRNVSVSSIIQGEGVHVLEISTATDKVALYRQLAASLDALLAGEIDEIANLANAAALLYHSLPDINWAGFYLLRSGELVLGPFQGKPACVRIALDRG